jgi:hypothetical protein
MLNLFTNTYDLKVGKVISKFKKIQVHKNVLGFKLMLSNYVFSKNYFSCE